jgi:hypothetical protein
MSGTGICMGYKPNVVMAKLHHHLFPADFSLIQAAMQYNRGRRLHGVWHHSDPVEQEDGKQEPAPNACEHRELGVKDIPDIRLCYALQAGHDLPADRCALYLSITVHVLHLT